MGKNGALNAWLREFCSLVFTQTLQAFIYAIIITLIMAGLNYTNEYSQTEIINKTSVGIINIFALTSIFKIEEMARKIFGLQRSGFQNESPMQTMAKFAFMARFGRRLWDNGKKMVKGGFGISKGFKDKRKARRKYYKDNIKLSEKISKAAEDCNQALASSGGTEEGADVATTSVLGRGVSSGASTGAGGTLDVATLNINATNVNMNGSGAAATDAEKLEKLEDKYKSLLESRNDLKDKYDDSKSAANKQIQDSLHMMLSGVSETIGATLGGAVGAVIGGADGKNVAQGVVVGMNAGDRLGQGVVDVGFAGKDVLDNIKKDLKVKADIGDLKIKSDKWNEALDDLQAAITDSTESARTEITKLADRIRRETADRRRTAPSVDTDDVVHDI